VSLKAKLYKANNHSTTVNDWLVRKDKWLVSVSKLYETVEQWLSEFITEGYVQLTREEMSLSEEHIGEYQIAKLEIGLGNHAVVLEPVGTRIRRAYGRVDFFLRGEKARGFMLILTKNDDDQDEWRVVNRNTRGDIRPVFCQPLFEEALNKWINQIL